MERVIVGKVKAKGGLRELCNYESKEVSFKLFILEGKCEMPLQTKTQPTDQIGWNIHF